VAAGYKWLLGPYGFGLLYVSEQWREARPLEETWLARKNAMDFTALVKYSDTYMPGARRFDVGEKCTATIRPAPLLLWNNSVHGHREYRDIVIVDQFTTRHSS